MASPSPPKRTTRILDHLRIRESDVVGLVDALSLSELLASKHLRALRDSGTVTATFVGQRRLYRPAEDTLSEVLAWLTPYHQMRPASADRLTVGVDDEENR